MTKNFKIDQQVKVETKRGEIDGTIIDIDHHNNKVLVNFKESISRWIDPSKVKSNE